MRPIRLFFYMLLLLYHAILLGLALNLESALAERLRNSPELVRTLALIGLAFFLIVFAFALYDRRHYQKRIAKVEAEKNEIKAQVFDMKRREEELDREIKSFESSITKKEATPKKDTDSGQTTQT